MAARFFASDNSAPVHPAVMDALGRVNRGHEISYGDDRYTREAVSSLSELFGGDAEVHFVYNGTGANVLGMASVLSPYQSIIATDVSHIYEDECGAPQRFTGSALLTTEAEQGKLRTETVEPFLHWQGVQHHVQPAVISLTNATELGTVYTPAELGELSEFAHAHDMLVHVDGARIANAACRIAERRGISPRAALRAVTTEAGIDVLSFGATKNGIMFGEAVVFFRNGRRTVPAAGFPFVRKQGMQLASKMRYIAAQFRALVEDDLWAKNASHANAMADRLAAGLTERGIALSYPVEANAVFAALPAEIIVKLQERRFFYVWDETSHVVRLMASFDTDEEDVDGFLGDLDELSR